MPRILLVCRSGIDQFHRNGFFQGLSIVEWLDRDLEITERKISIRRSPWPTFRERRVSERIEAESGNALQTGFRREPVMILFWILTADQDRPVVELGHGGSFFRLKFHQIQ